jgi:radical SAM superfamily enzyme YgiQ (UPF0313 family)
LGPGEPLTLPLGLAYLKASLKNHEVRVFDANASDRPFNEMEEIIREYGPEVIGISLRNIDSTNKRKVVFYYRLFKKAVGMIKGCCDAPIVVGGSGFSMFAREVMEDEPDIDYGVFLEGENVFPRLLDNLDSPEDVESVYYRKGGKVVFTAAGTHADVNSISMADRSGLPLEKYRNVRDSIGVETKRGCALNCIYCIYGFLNGRNYRLRDTVAVVDEIEHIVRELGINKFTFTDSVFNVPADHAQSICKEIVRRRLDVTWSAWFIPAGLTEDFVELLVEAGCRNIILSPDGFSDNILQALGKNMTKEDVVKTHMLLEKMTGFEVSYNFFKNPPGQTLSDFLSLLIFCFGAKRRMGPRVHFEFNSMRVEPHTGLHELAMAEGAVKADESLLYPRYYTNAATRYVDWLFNLMLVLKGK